jgi:hypothetical protein
MKIMRLFFVLVCCFAIPLVARAADQDNQDKNKKEKPITQGQQQQQTGKLAKHNDAKTASQLNSPSQLKGEHNKLNAQNNNLPAVQSNTKRKVEAQHNDVNTASQLSGQSRLKGQGQHHRLNAENNNLPAVQSNTKGKLEAKHQGANTASQLNNPSKLKGEHKELNAQNNNLPTVQSNIKGKVEAKHFNLATSPNPKIESTKFSQNYRIQGSERWQGQKYSAFQNYRSESHDQGWWHQHHDRIILISGGWYFWNAGYWYPAWGYDSAAAYYPYNGPIYAYHNLSPDQVTANVQSALQAQGYYQGEIDGLLGPITRAALANYQEAHGLYTTEAIDEPTLDSLGMS